MTIKTLVSRTAMSVFTALALLGVAVAVTGRQGSGYVLTPVVTEPERFYRFDAIRPSASQQQMRDRLISFYQDWKAAFVRLGCTRDTYRVVSPDATYPYIAEAQGYGLVIAVSMARYDTQARRLFDGILGFVLEHPSGNNPALMAAELDARCTERAGGDSATDGDLDVAYALLIADRVWGSAGSYNYRQLALRRMQAIRASNVNPGSGLLLLGDWSRRSEPRLYATSRTSDWNLHYFRTFATVDPAWADVTLAHQSAITRLRQAFSPSTGLLPDFAEGAGDRLRPAAGKVLETSRDGSFGFNACRTPWRLGVDAIVSGDPVSTSAAKAITGWFRAATGDDPDGIGSGYALNGTPYRTEPDNAFWAPLAVSAMADPTAQPWLDALWAKLATTRVDPGNYFGDTIQLQVMIVVSGAYPIL